MAEKVPKITLNNGFVMPGFGLGTYESLDETYQAVKWAIDAGYRHFDTAYLYGNEKPVADAIKDKIKEGVVTREEIFIVTKLWNTFHEPEKVEPACRRSLENLGLDYIDLYLIHWPFGFKERNPFEAWPMNPDGQFDMTDVDYIDTWKEMERLVDLKLVRSIGVSNFNSQQIVRLLKVCRIKPVNNQIEVSPQVNEKDLVKLCNDHNIVVTAYCPLGRPEPKLKQPKFLFDGKLKKIGDKYNKTPAQVIFRYLLQNGTIPIPKSVNKNRIEENINVFDFKLTDDELKFIDSYNTGDRVLELEEAKHHKYFPF